MQDQVKRSGRNAGQMSIRMNLESTSKCGKVYREGKS